ncbi:MAG TPA: S9 family peptidase [Thermoplasmata archaeon]|nr:S9 family peptidase [Thermoplasmata archaeon]
MSRPVEAEDLAAYAFLSEPSLSPDGSLAALSVHRALLDKDEYESNLWLVPLHVGAPRQLTTAGKDSAPKFSPDGNRILFTSRREMGKDDKGNGLYVIPVDGGEARFLLPRKEGIDAPAWSPDGTRVLFLSNVGTDDEDIRTVRRINFWYNEKGFIYNLRKHVFVLDLSSNEVKQLTQGEFDVAHAYWSHDGKRIAYTAATEDGRPYLSDLFVLDVAAGSAQQLTPHTMEIGTAAWSPDDRRILFTGDELPRGFASHEHLWWIDVAGGKPERVDAFDRNVSPGLNCDVRMGGMNAEPKWVGNRITFAVAEGGAAHLYGMNASTRKAELLVGGDRAVEAFQVHGDAVVFTAMERSRLPELYVSQGQVRALTSFNARATDDLDLLAPERLTFRASDGETVEGWLFKPQKEGKVPLILYIHGGPKTAFGHTYVHEFQVFAAKGYAVLATNPRGSDGYSEAFADIRTHYGERDYQDLMEAVDHVIAVHPWIDGSRLAVAGGSYGGFMTNWIIGQTTRFKAAVTDRGIANWWTFWATSDIGPHFTKDQVGVDPWEDEETTMAKSPIRYVKNVTTPLLIVHSFEDLRCWHVEALQMYTALKYYGKEAELFLVPKENHELSRGGKPKHRVARLKAYLGWFGAHLT